MPRLIVPRPIEIPVGPSIAYVPLTQGQYALIDSDDALLVGKYAWVADFSSHTRTFYARTHANIEGRKSTRLHRLILDEPRSFVDHRNGNTLDCRKSNLRPAGHGQNLWNQPARRNNRTGIKGAQWNKRNRNWYSYIQMDGKKRFLGIFATAEAAGEAYRQASLELHGEHSYYARGNITCRA